MFKTTISNGMEELRLQQKITETSGMCGVVIIPEENAIESTMLGEDEFLLLTFGLPFELYHQRLFQQSLHRYHTRPIALPCRPLFSLSNTNTNKHTKKTNNTTRKRELGKSYEKVI